MEKNHPHKEEPEEHHGSNTNRNVALAIIGIIVLTIIFALLFVQGKLF